MAASSRNPRPSAQKSSLEPKTAFVSTLGGKPQVFTFVLDCLIETHGLIDRALAVHLAPSDPRINRAVNVLRAETAARYRSAFRFDSITIRDQPDAALLSAGAFASGRVITSIEDYAAPNAIWLTMHRLLTTLKAEGYRIILAVTGGPRLIGLQAVSVASLLFAPHDRCVHLFTPPDLSEAAGEGTILHVPNFAKRGIRLVDVPLLQLGMLFPHLQAAASLSPHEIVAQRTQQLSAQELQRCYQVLRGLTPRERQILQAFAQGASSVKAVAEQLSIKPSTVDTHKTKIFGLCRNAWGLDEGEPRHHSFLHEKFGDLPDLIWQEFA